MTAPKFLDIRNDEPNEEANNILRQDFSQAEIDLMDWATYVQEHNYIVDEIREGIMADRHDAMVYGDDYHESYLVSDEYENDCYSEKFDWIKNA